MTSPIGGIGRQVPTRTITASATATVDDYQILANATSGAITVTLFTSPGDNAFYELIVQKTDSSANAVTVTDGTFTFSLAAQSDAVICQLTAAGAWIGISGFDPSGSGDVEGPGSATSGDLATFNGTTGKIIADSGIVATTLSSTASLASVVGASAATAAVSAGAAASVADSKAVSAAKGSPLGTVVVSATSVVTPTAGATVAFMECWGAGGGGGGVSAAANSAGAGAGGGTGGYSAKWVTTLASSYSIGVGASGASGAENAGTGGTGGSTLISTVISAAGGVGGTGQAASTFLLPAAAGAGGAVTTGGDINVAGNPGFPGIRLSATSCIGGNGGATQLGGAGQGSAGDAVGGDAQANTGSGGGGATSNSATSRAGGAGGSGVAILTFYR